MFVSSVALYLAVRKSTLQKIPTQYNNLAMFAVPLILFTSVAIATRQNFLIPLPLLFIIFAAGVFFSYLGNLASLISIEKAPNPGYSLVISKSYVVFTTVVAIVLFNAEINFKKIAAIIVIICFSTLLMLSQKTTRKNAGKTWLPLALVAFFCWGMLSLTSKYLFNQGVNMFVFLTYTYLTVTICIVFEMVKKITKFSQIFLHRNIFVLIGIASTGFNLFQFEAIKSAPNVGYVNAINASSISAVTLLAIMLFKDEFSKRKLIGVFGITIGLLLLLT